MKTWVVLFLILLAAGVAWGLARDLFSREKGALTGTVLAINRGNPVPKWFPATPPRFKVRLPDGRLIDVATQNPQSVQVGANISITEWMTPWGQVWYTQRD
ncbi:MULTISPECIES: hypothetical protein [unclassified Hyphomicrobium]|uniref:hypothetical protein n=1 Tax=unclassified Hyphomicrobium TaxID=2619925 RepID=UPI000213F7F3|nr:MULTISPECIES: hypothetical protein [unclassified Hyphomicrobium]CCB63335.1 exported protein of unknown function [Hyphomicrobium sp. MC1]